ncbi:XopAF/AvrXv3 family type III secretion system effector [Xanthomonas euvesicatoria]|uniref:XopAF/AvrXv3 family type III secretion system effector n=1 Tax=Xanthomonas euvesicatoria TaxID=456327 RepID=UPI001C470DEB|nr:XopAF/AvrXv3 family type III secretion system effector [Xanthomonas euvesicatoria]MBV6843729.1 avirulence protein AvrXv3 [Xanthomonas campestris pv. fici]
MTNSISRYSYNPANFPQLEQMSDSQNQAERSHPSAPLKDRSHEEAFPARLASARIRRRSGASEEFVLNRNKPIKGVGYSTVPTATASTGTSKPGVLCMTDGLDLCVGVAVVGEKPSENKGKARVFHVMPENRRAQWEIKSYIEGLRSQGYAVKAAIHGGDSSSRASVSKVDAIQATLGAMDVPREFSRTGAGASNGNGPLGAVVEENGTVRFVTALAK